MNFTAAFAFTLLISLVACSGCGQTCSDLPKPLTKLDIGLIEQHGKLSFVNDVKVGCQLAGEQRLPCMIFFTAEWCTYCHEMAETAFDEHAVGELARNFVCIIVDADRERDLCRHFSIAGFPTVEFVSPDGHSLHRLVGQQSPVSLAAGMRDALGRYTWVSDSLLQQRRR